MKSFKYRLYPTNTQKALLSKHFGATRFVYNYFLAQRRDYYLQHKEDIQQKNIKGSLNYYDNAKELTQLKKQEATTWLKEINAQSLQTCLKDLEGAYRRFFNKQAQFPKFKKKHGSTNSFRVPQHVRVEENQIFFPKFKEGIKVKFHRPLEGKLINATVSRNPAGHYFVSVSCEVEIVHYETTNKNVGLDLGIKDFAVCSDEQTFSNPKPLKALEKRLAFRQKHLSTKQKGSQSRNKARNQVAKVHNKIRNQRHHFLHQASSKMIHENQVIILEDLNVKGMMKNHKLAKAISDSSWSRFVTFLEYKASWYGRDIVKIDRWFPSSKMCGNCHYIHDELTLKDRHWTCPECNTKHDRDLNASKNILTQGLNLLSGSGTESDTKQKREEALTLVESMNPEAYLSLANG